MKQIIQMITIRQSIAQNSFCHLWAIKQVNMVKASSSLIRFLGKNTNQAEKAELLEALKEQRNKVALRLLGDSQWFFWWWKYTPTPKLFWILRWIDSFKKWSSARSERKCCTNFKYEAYKQQVMAAERWLLAKWEFQVISNQTNQPLKG